MRLKDIKIAIGWATNSLREVKSNHGTSYAVYKGREWLGGSISLEPLINCLPDYCNDLNAMHEVEKLLKDNKPVGVHSPASTYRVILYRIVERDGRSLVGWGHATALQRAEAYLRTVNRWVGK